MLFPAHNSFDGRPGAPRCRHSRSPWKSKPRPGPCPGATRQQALEKAEGKTNSLQNPFKKLFLHFHVRLVRCQEKKSLHPVQAVQRGCLLGHLRSYIRVWGRLLSDTQLPSSCSTLSSKTCAKSVTCMHGKHRHTTCIQKRYENN